MIQLVFLLLYFSKRPSIFYHFVFMRNSFQNFQNLPFLPPFRKDLFIALISDFFFLGTFLRHKAKDSCIVDSNTTTTTFWSWLNHSTFKISHLQNCFVHCLTLGFMEKLEPFSAFSFFFNLS